MVNHNYIAYTFKVEPLQPATEILIAELGYAGFESFMENQEGVIAYIPKKDWSENSLEPIEILKSKDFSITYTFLEIEATNWNAEWERNFKPIVVANSCTVRAPFHKKPNTKYDIVIEPKMSFGTGHHETTHLMLQHILNTNMQNKTVLDMGCGTGVLAILSGKKGATKIDAIDIDTWCYQNTTENIQRNNCKNTTVYLGDASLIKNKKYHIILANINRNILIKDLPKYAAALLPNGMLFLSGFYNEDIPLVEKKANANRLKLQEKLQKNKWVSLKFIN